MASFGVNVIRAGLGILSGVSPDFAARCAYRLFCTTESRKPKGAKAAEAHTAGMRILAAAQRMRLPISDGSVMTYAFQGGEGRMRPRVLVVHGWGSAAAYLAPMALGLAGQGLDVVVLDLPGHGESSGRTLDVRRAVEAIAVCSRQHGPFDTIVGHSFGGASTVMAASGFLPCHPATRCGGLVVIGAPSRLGFVFAGFARMLGLSPDIQVRMEREAERRTGRHPEEFDAAALVQSLPVRVLVLHAEDDKEVDADNARRYAKGARNARVEWANGLGHRRIVSDPGVIARVARFVHGQSEAAAA